MDDALIREELQVLQADLDDESPEVLAHAVERLLAAGALDAHLCPLLMKKGRPAMRLEVLCRPEQEMALVELLLRETATLGVKSRLVVRYALPRRTEKIDYHGFSIRLKVATLDGQFLKAKPEFEDCRRAAEALGVPLRTVMEEARLRYLRQLASE